MRVKGQTQGRPNTTSGVGYSQSTQEEVDEDYKRPHIHRP